MQTSKDFLHIFLDMGDALLNSGAEIFRVEDTLNRMGYACGAAQMNVFVITSSIVITMEFPEEGARTQTRRIRESGGNDFTKLEQLNDLSRRFCNHPVPAAELRKEFDKINDILKQLNELTGFESFIHSEGEHIKRLLIMLEYCGGNYRRTSSLCQEAKKTNINLDDIYACFREK